MARMKVPKRVAGVKLPKKLRKQAKQALKLADSPAVRSLTLAGLALAAESMVDRVQSKSIAKSAAKEVLEQARGGRKQRRKAVKRNLQRMDLGEVLRGAAVEAARRFLEGFEEGRRASEDAGKDAAAGPARERRARGNGKPPSRPGASAAAE